MSDAAGNFLKESIEEFRKIKGLADRALAQIDEAQFFHLLDPETNPPALIVKHLAGNLRSRWSDFLTTDGEKPDRRRDREFELEPEDTRESLMRRWEDGWAILLAELELLSAADMTKVVTIRCEPHTVTKAIVRQLAHYGYHAGQIVQLCKHLRAGDWQTLSVARGRSEEFNREMDRKAGH